MSEVRPGNSQRGDYPRMLYHADGRTIVVQDPEAHQQLFDAGGWDTVPPDNPARPVSHHGVLGAVSDPLVETLRQVIREELRQALREHSVRAGIERDPVTGRIRSSKETS